MTEKLRVDMTDLTLRELARVAELLDPVTLADAITGSQQPRAIAALVCVVRQRDDPTFTFDDALDMRMTDVELVNPESPGEAIGGANGAARAALPELGDSIPSA